jgi:YHS domain-containing protein
MSFRRILLLSLLTLAQAFFPVQASEPVSKSYFGDIAIGGYDTVAYHGAAANNPPKAIKGNKAWKAKWKGANWLFTTEVDRDLFTANPERYAPAYNGHCANALSLGEGLIETDGTHWQIFEGQLYTFYAARGRDRWMDGNLADYKKVADKAWQKIISH